MKFSNFTPFPSLSWDSVDCNNDWYVTSVSRIRYQIIKNDSSNKLTLKYHKDQGDLFGTDIYHGEVGNSSLKYESDFVTYKKNADLIVNANSYPPKNIEQKEWTSCVRVYDDSNKKLLDYALEIKAEKIYHKAGIIWTPTLRKKVNKVNISYEKAYGGNINIIKKDNSEENIYINEYNPVGCGVKKIKDNKQIVNAVQIYNINSKDKNIPAGYGFIGKSWKNRLDYSGTYDDEWLENVHPLPPKDFDDAFNQAANPNLIFDGYAKANYKVQLENLLDSHDLCSFSIPDIKMLTCLKNDIKDLYSYMNIDTIIVDVDSDDESEHSIYVSFRTKQSKKFDIKEAQVILVPDEQIKAKYG